MGLNNLGSVQALLAQNIRAGLSGLGDRPLDEAQFGLNKAQLEHTMGRQAEQDAQSKAIFEAGAPGREVASRVAENQLARADAPVRITDFAPDMNTLEHMMYTPQDNWAGMGAPQNVKDPMITRIADMYGAKWDANPQSPTRGQMIKADGTPITKEMVNRDSAPLQAFIVANTGLDHETRKNEEQLLRKYENKKITKEEYNAGMESINKFKSSLPAQMKYAQSKIDFLSRFTNQGDPLFQGEISDGLKRWQGKYDKLGEMVQKKRDKLDDQKFEKEKMQFDRDTKLMVAGLKEGKDLTQKEIDAQNRLKKEHLVGKLKELGFLIQMDEEGGVVASMTKVEASRAKSLGKGVGLSVYMEATGEERDRPGWFTGDDPLYTVSIVPDTAEKGSKPVQKPFEPNNVDSFIDKQLGRYPDVNATPEQAAQAVPELQPAHGKKTKQDKKKEDFFINLSKQVGQFDEETNKNIEEFIKKAKNPSMEGLYKNVPGYR